jgi:AcrR family transcriptional regulator
VPVSKSPERCVTEARIVEAAAQLFARQGFKATTTREIAELAAVHEATLYRHFAGKPDIFVSAMKSRLGTLRMSRELQTSLLETASPNETIEKIIRFFVESFTQQPELVRLLQVATFEVPGAEAIIREHLGPIFDSMSGYYRRSAAKREICEINPSLATVGLLALVAANQYLVGLFSNGPISDLDKDAGINSLGQLWLRALKPSIAGPESCA